MPSVHAPILSEQAAAFDTASAPFERTRITAPTLVSTRWLRDNHATVRTIDTRPSQHHAAGSVPGSVSLPLDALRLDDTSRPSIERLARDAQQTLARLGISPDDHVVLIDDADGSAALGAAICELAGMRSVSAVHGGGIDAWHAQGGDLHPSDDVAAATTIDAWASVLPRTSMVAAFEDLVDAVVDGTSVVVDARSQLEHEGIVGAPCCGARGAIPGSVHVEWTAFFDIADEPRSSTQVREIAAHLGLEPGTPIIATCHAGHRAAVAARVLRAAGFRDVRVSIGSWHEWSLRGLVDDEA